MKNFIINIYQKVNVELRRKAGNLITKAFLIKFYDNINPIDESEFILSLTIDEIKDKITQAKKLDGPESIKMTYINNCKEAYKKTINNLKKFIDNKDEILINVMNIINLIWLYLKKQTDIFCDYLDKLGLNLSYVERIKNSNIIDFVLLTKIPSTLYNYISTYADGDLIIIN